VYPLEVLEDLEPPAGGWFPAQRLRVHSAVGAVQLLNVHLRPQIGSSGANLAGIMSGAISTPPIRRDEIEAYLSHLEPGVATLIGGDFNEGETGGAFARLEARGYLSVLPEFSDEPTWRWDLGSLGRVERRFDHLVCNRALDVLSARVIHAGRSDHLPVFAIFRAARPRLGSAPASGR
jgi:endonuclease/exonuclease/phosphatase family metal-dependent hydrolase